MGQKGDGSFKKRKANMLVFLLYLIFGLYFINSTFGFIAFPDFVLDVDRWIIFVGGILIIFGAINYFRAARRSRRF